MPAAKFTLQWSVRHSDDKPAYDKWIIGHTHSSGCKFGDFNNAWCNVDRYLQEMMFSN